MSATQILEVGTSPVIHLRVVRGDLALSGVPQTQIQMSDGVHQDVVVAGQAAENGSVIRLRCEADCALRIPRDSTLHIDEVQGDANIHGVTGAVNIARVDGDLRVHQCGSAVVQEVNGDLAVTSVSGDLHVGTVVGDVSITRVAGDCRVQKAADDLTVATVQGNIDVNAGDDVSLRIDVVPGTAVHARAGGDLACRVPRNVAAVVALQAGGEIAVRRLPVDAVKGQAANFTLGGGAATLNLAAGGDLTLTGVDPSVGQVGADFGQDVALNAAEFAQQIASQVEVQVQNVTRQLDEKLSQLAADDELAARIQERVQSAVRMAETKIAEALRKADERARAAERRTGQSKTWQTGYSWSWQAPPPAKAPKPSAPSLSDEERMMVLRMVEEGKLSVGQAEQLLSAMRKDG